MSSETVQLEMKEDSLSSLFQVKDSRNDNKISSVVKNKDDYLIVAGLAGNCEKFVDMCIKSIEKDADKIIIVYDTTSKDKSYEKLQNWKNKLGDKLIILERVYEHDEEAKNANSDARTFYLDYLKKNFSGCWCLVLDMDEVVDEKFSELKEFLKRLENENKNRILISPQMVHFIGDLCHEDATYPKHHVPNRLFKVDDTLYYTKGEHPVLNSSDKVVGARLELFKIYHLGYVINNIYYLKERFKTHLSKSEIHSQEFLRKWYDWHITGSYPKSPIDVNSLPKIIKDEFYIDDYFYFKDRQLEHKHWIAAIHWKEFFKPK